MKRVRVIVLVTVLMLMLGGGATACGSSSTHAASLAGQTASAVNRAASPPAGTCASAGTRKIPETRLLADLALTYGAFHRYLYNPYKSGVFRKGARGRTKAIIKARLASAAIVKLLSDASENAAADPALCKFIPNIGNVTASLANMADQIKGGTATAGDADTTNVLFNQLKNGTGFTPPRNPSLPGVS